MKRNHHDYLRDARDMALRLVAIDEGLPEAIRQLRLSQPGYPTSSRGGGGASALADDGTPSGLAKFVMRPDRASVDLRDLDRLLLTAREQVAQLHRIVSLWSSAPSRDEKVTTPAGQGECQACATFCSGADNDRLRSGLCNACRVAYQRWQKANGADRFRWLIERRAELSEVEEA